jgi:hypothetical protein
MGPAEDFSRSYTSCRAISAVILCGQASSGSASLLCDDLAAPTGSEPKSSTLESAPDRVTSKRPETPRNRSRERFTVFSTGRRSFHTVEAVGSIPTTPTQNVSYLGETPPSVKPVRDEFRDEFSARSSSRRTRTS